MSNKLLLRTTRNNYTIFHKNSHSQLVWLWSIKLLAFLRNLVKKIFVNFLGRFGWKKFTWLQILQFFLNFHRSSSDNHQKTLRNLLSKNFTRLVRFNRKPPTRNWTLDLRKFNRFYWGISKPINYKFFINQWIIFSISEINLSII